MAKIKLFNDNNIDVLKKLDDNSIDSIVTDPPYGISFMNNKWDYDVPNVDFWKEVYRVLKPGAHGLVACGTRTQHRMVVNIEDSGFEIRDIISWIYGSGMPKGVNIGKSIDKKFGNSREVIGYVDSPDFRDVGKKSKDVNGQDKLSFGQVSNAKRKKTEITKGNSEWEGWNTSLKPSMELFTLIRKPLSEKTISDNVLKWGTGGINIGDTMINTEGSDKGRYPANVIHDGSDDVVSKFPNTKSGLMKENHKRSTDGSPNGIYGKFNPNHPLSKTFGDEGSASRFFYCAKPSPKERHSGNIKNDHPTIKPIKLMEYLVKLISKPGMMVLDPFMGSGTTGIACKNLDIDFIGIELEEDYFKIAKDRINTSKTKSKKLF